MSTDLTVITVDIVAKTLPGGWRIIGLCPYTVAPSGGLHLYAGRNARALDSLTDELIATGHSLPDLLQTLADSTGLIVVCLDETTDLERRYTPGGERS